MDPRIKRVVWEKVEGGCHAKTILGELDVMYEWGSTGRWLWRFADKTAWLPCVSMEAGQRDSEAMFQHHLSTALV